MSSVGDIWASMQDDEERRKKEYNAKRALSSLPTMGGSGGVRMEVAVKATRKGSKRGLTKEQKRAASESVSIVMSQGSAAVTGESADNICIGNGSEAGAAATVISASAMMAKLGRDINIIDGSESSAARRKSLAEIHANLFARHSMSEGDYNEVFREVCRSVFKKFADPAEKCRELTLRITLGFFERGSDFVPVLGYLFPAFMQRVPAGLAYDEDMKVFVHDIEAHEAYRRGKAVERQDRTGSVGPSVHTVVEPSEEIRFLVSSSRALLHPLVGLTNPTRPATARTGLHCSAEPHREGVRPRRVQRAQPVLPRGDHVPAVAAARPLPRPQGRVLRRAQLAGGPRRLRAGHEVLRSRARARGAAGAAPQAREGANLTPTQPQPILNSPNPT